MPHEVTSICAYYTLLCNEQKLASWSSTIEHSESRLEPRTWETKRPVVTCSAWKSHSDQYRLVLRKEHGSQGSKSKSKEKI